MKTNSSNSYEAIALDALINKLTKQYDSLFFVELDEQLFIYRTINRKEYKDILRADIDDLEKQDQICKTCILYPENFNIDDCDGGIPQQLYKEIIEKSCILIEDMILLIEMNREEMDLLDNQMSCVIAEAFPSYKLEEIESMDMIQFIKLFTRAEWILNNFKDHRFSEDIVNLLSSSISDKKEEKQNITYNEEKNESNDKIISPQQQDDKSNRKQMTPEQYREYQEFCKRFPEFNMASDYAFTGDSGIGFNRDAPALRPGWGITKKNK